MSTHWTYLDPGDDENLNQGDFLYPTAELRKLLALVFPTFDDAKYIGFIVASQTCDIVLRKGAPKADYVNLAAVRPLHSLMPKFLSAEGGGVSDRIYKHSAKAECRQFLERLFNQNESGHGLFYLHPSPDLSVGEESVAVLRVSFALKSQHYGLLVRARRARLQPEFQNKLGWMVGNLYSRVAVRDWSEVDQGKLEKMVDGALCGSLFESEYSWIPDEDVDACVSAGVDMSTLAYQDILKKIDEHKPKDVKDDIADAVSYELDSVLRGLNKNPAIQLQIDDGLRDIIKSKLANRLVNSSKLKHCLVRIRMNARQ